MLRAISQLFIEVGAHIGPSGCVDHPGSPQNIDGAVDANAVRERHYLLEIQMLSIFRRLMKNEKGATAIEYTLIASLIAVAAITAMSTVGTKISNVLTNVGNALE